MVHTNSATACCRRSKFWRMMAVCQELGTPNLRRSSHSLTGNWVGSALSATGGNRSKWEFNLLSLATWAWVLAPAGFTPRTCSCIASATTIILWGESHHAPHPNRFKKKPGEPFLGSVLVVNLAFIRPTTPGFHSTCLWIVFTPNLVPPVCDAS